MKTSIYLLSLVALTLVVLTGCTQTSSLTTTIATGELAQYYDTGSKFLDLSNQHLTEMPTLCGPGAPAFAPEIAVLELASNDIESI